MKQHAITHKKTGKIIFEGAFRTLRHCIETAASQQADLSGADLRRVNLANANLDGAKLENADFSGANLLGANLSESFLSGSDFSNANLHSACLCFSDLTSCDFSGALLDGMDIAGATLDRCAFSTLSALRLDFTAAETLHDCRFREECGGAEAWFSLPPLFLSGLELPVAAFDHHLKIGGALLPLGQWFGRPDSIPDPRARAFFHRHRSLIAAVTAKRRPRIIEAAA